MLSQLPSYANVRLLTLIVDICYHSFEKRKRPQERIFLRLHWFFGSCAAHTGALPLLRTKKLGAVDIHTNSFLLYCRLPVLWRFPCGGCKKRSEASVCFSPLCAGIRWPVLNG